MGNQLPVNVENCGKTAHGNCTPKDDKKPQKMSVPPKRVLPIIFLPGIMGSNLRMSSKRQSELKKGNNIAWRPDRKMEMLKLANASPDRRQKQLDFTEVELDIYDPKNNITGDPHETSDERHEVEKIDVSLNVGAETPLLIDDPSNKKNNKTKKQKAMLRGWGEIFYGSYQKILEDCEQQLNSNLNSKLWPKIFGVDPVRWGAYEKQKLKPLSEDDYKKAVSKCWFPVHAMGYNWLEGNGSSAIKTADRIRSLMSSYRALGYQCEKVIIVTHSMGGLVARAIIHPDFGKLDAEVLGMVHGVMPAAGAPATYKRIRSGTEGGKSDVASRVLGQLGSEVTAVLANSQGGLELLPSSEYGNNWLEIRQGKKLLKTLPENGDPYNEIYLLKTEWFRLLKEEWINPAKHIKSNLERTFGFLIGAKNFHEKIKSTYHKNTYVHYGCDSSKLSWEKVVWNFDEKCKDQKWPDIKIFLDDEKGNFYLSKLEDRYKKNDSKENLKFSVVLGNNAGPGDQTVPMRSADQQLLSGKVSGIFRQSGYVHQDSYQNDSAINSTLFSLIKLISLMVWTSHE